MVLTVLWRGWVGGIDCVMEWVVLTVDYEVGGGRQCVSYVGCLVTEGMGF